MKKKINQIVSLVMVFFMTFTMFAPLANAVSYGPLIASDKTHTYNIQITELEDDQKMTVTAYKIIEVDMDWDNVTPKDPMYKWVPEVNTWLKNHPTYSIYANKEPGGTGQGVEKYLEDYDLAPANGPGNGNGNTPENAIIGELYDALAASIRSSAAGTINGADLDPKTGNNLNASLQPTDTATISGVTLGSYLILIENGLFVYRPAAVNVIPEYSETDPKGWYVNQTPVLASVKKSEVSLRKNIVKKEDTGRTSHTSEYTFESNTKKIDVAYGQNVKFMIAADIPQYQSGATNKTYEISDFIAPGFTVVPDGGVNYKVYGEKVAIEGDDVDRTLLTEGSTTEYTVEQSALSPINADDVQKLGDISATSGNATYKFVFDYEKIKEYRYIIIEYTANINASTAVNTQNNTNTAYIQYTNDQYTNKIATQADRDTVYTYGMEITKVGTDPNVGLADAGFRIEDEAGNEIKLIEVDSGVYRMPVSTDNPGNLEEIIRVDSDGKLYITGVDLGTYKFFEEEVPAGYTKPTSPFEITVSDADLNGQPLDGETDSDDGYVEATFVNKTGMSLPETGGIGTILFTIGGIVLMGIGLIIIKSIRKKETM